MKKGSVETREKCINLRKEGRTIKEICIETGLSIGTVSRYTAEYSTKEANIAEKTKGFGYDLLADWTNTVNIGRKKMGLEPFPMPVLENK